MADEIHYVGEIVRLAVVAHVSRSPTVSTPLVPADINDGGATISVWRKGADDFSVHEEPLVWDDAYEVWRYNWDTTNEEPGTYLVKSTFTGPGGLRSWEIDSETVRLTADKTLVVDP